MSKAIRRKHVMSEAIWDDYVLPKPNQSVVKVLKNRGNNLHEVKPPTGEEFLVSMPVKFRKMIWVQRGDYLLVEPIPEGDKVKAEMVKKLNRESIKYLKENNVWPAEFDVNDRKVTDSNNDEDLLMTPNTNHVQFTEGNKSDSDSNSDTEQSDSS